MPKKDRKQLKNGYEKDMVNTKIWQDLQNKFYNMYEDIKDKKSKKEVIHWLKNVDEHLFKYGRTPFELPDINL